MGIIKQGILGGFKGKVGSVVGSSWKGLSVMKAMPLSVANPRTAGQVSQRTKFSMLATFFSLILAGWVKPLWDRFSTQMSGYNAIMSANKDNIDPDNGISMSEMIMSKGRVMAPVITLPRADLSDSAIEFEINQSVGDRYALQTDKLYFVAFNKTTQGVLSSGDTGISRSDVGTSLVVTQPVTGEMSLSDVVEIAFAWLRADGSEVSGSTVVSANVSA